MEIINFEPQIDDLNFFVANMLSKISNSDSYKDMGESSKKIEYLTFILIAWYNYSSITSIYKYLVDAMKYLIKADHWVILRRGIAF